MPPESEITDPDAVAALEETNAPSFVGGLRYQATGGIFSGRFNASSPLARLTIGADQATVTLRRGGALGMRLTGLDFPREMSLRPEEVRIVEPDFHGLFSRGVRFRTVDPTDQRDGLVFWTASNDRGKIVELLAAAGFRIAPH